MSKWSASAIQADIWIWIGQVEADNETEALERAETTRLADPNGAALPIAAPVSLWVERLPDEYYGPQRPSPRNLLYQAWRRSLKSHK